MPDYLISTIVPNENAPATVRERIVRAKNEAQAVRFALIDTIKVQRATIDDAMRLAAAGVKVETAAE